MSRVISQKNHIFWIFLDSDGLLIQPGGKRDCASPPMRRSLGAERRPASEGYT